MAHSISPPHRTPITDCRLNHQSFVPLYRQIKDLLLERMENGDLAVGDLVPSEKQLGAAFEVSRLTVRQALYKLRLEGYVIREKGRGTFVRISTAFASCRLKTLGTESSFSDDRNEPTLRTHCN